MNAQERRVYHKHTDGFITSRQLDSAIFQLVPAGRPQEPGAYWAEW
jgi:hypothetical protein